MASIFLTKSDFKACFDCRTRLYYRKKGYPSAADDDEFLRMLADGGFMIEFLAKERYPDGVDLAAMRNPEEAATRTSELLAAGDVTLFEAGVIHEKFHVRTDILRKVGNVLELIEVKSSAVEDDEDDAASPFLNKKGSVQSRWREYLLDVAFQAYVLRLAFPAYTVRPVLCVVNKSHAVQEPETLGRFRVTKDPRNPKARPEISYAGDRTALRTSRLLVFRSVETEVTLLRDEVAAKAAELSALITKDGVVREQEPISDIYPTCRKCEYRTGEERSGFDECWGALARVNPHILELHRVSQIAGKGEADPVTALLRANRASILDLSETDLGTGGFAPRRLMQWRGLQDGGREHLPAAVRDELLAHQGNPGWPLHFIDFEACDISLPHHAGLRPYERVAFQWSCHTLQPDGAVWHHEWLNETREFPNFGFVRTLRNCIGEQGTVYVWSPYEQTTLRKVLEQIQGWLARDPAEAIRLSGLPDAAALTGLADWIGRLLGPADAKGKRNQSPRIRDLHKVAAAHYFHPRMGGRTSIKVVLPAVWESDARIRDNPCFARYVRYDATGAALDPYESLPALPFGDDGNEDDAVREGTGAIRVYQDLIFTPDAAPAGHQNRRRLLLQYCELDTAAMVMIWAHWLARYDLVPRS